jgi:hypothetical protein
MSKTRTGFRRAHCLAPVVGGGGYLVAGLGSVNRPFRLLRQFRETPEFGRKNRLGLPRGFPHRSVTIRLRLGNILISNRISSALFGACRRFDVSPAPSGRRLSSGRPPGCQPVLFRTPGPIPGSSGSSNQGPASRCGRRTLRPSAARLQTSRPGSDF